ncbi:MAG: hypothetical protein P4K83_00190 [Terracidiphilus sp.]|nr:hypothetical protein [Terracidiphilus sp.]
MDEWKEPEEKPNANPDTGLDVLAKAFSEQLIACLEEAARGRKGLFGETVNLDEGEAGWPEAERLRELAMALQSVFAQQEERYALADEFLDLCTMHGEYHPGERKLARTFLERIERGEVGSATEEKPW